MFVPFIYILDNSRLTEWFDEHRNAKIYARAFAVTRSQPRLKTSKRFWIDKRANEGILFGRRVLISPVRSQRLVESIPKSSEDVLVAFVGLSFLFFFYACVSKVRIS